MQEVFVEDKQKLLSEHTSFLGGYNLTDKFRCLHCGEVITAGDYKTYNDGVNGGVLIYCPNAPECDGTIIDWMPPDANF